MKKLSLILSCVISVSGISLYAQKSSPKVITIYNNNTAFIKEDRSLYAKKDGMNKILIENMPDSLVPNSVFAKFSKKSTKIISQTFSKNRLDFYRVLNYYKKHKLLVNFYRAGKDVNKRVEDKGAVLSSSFGASMLVENREGKVYTVLKKDIFFDTLPEELKVTKPTLYWKIYSKKGEQKVKLGYLITGLNWSAQYELNLDKRADLKGWISITNSSPTKFKDAKIFCVAGDVRVHERNRVKMLSRSVAFDAPAVKKESFGGYYLYKIPYREDLPNGLKLISFITKKGIGFKEFAKATINLPVYQTRGIKKISFSHIIKIDNSLKNSMGIPLPGGKVRVYSKDSSGLDHFIGESYIPNITKTSPVVLNIGRYFDIKAKLKQVSYQSSKDRHFIDSKLSITLINDADAKKDIKLDISYPIFGNYVIKSNCAGICSKKTLYAGKDEYSFNLDKDKKFTFFVEYVKR